MQTLNDAKATAMVEAFAPLTMNWPELPQGLCEECGQKHCVQSRRGKCDNCQTMLIQKQNGEYEPDEEDDYYDPESAEDRAHDEYKDRQMFMNGQLDY